MASDVYEGHDGRVIVGSQIANLEYYEARETTTIGPANNFESNLRRNYSGLSGLNVRCRGYYNRTVNYSANPFNLHSGAVVSLQLYQNKESIDEMISAPFVRLGEVTISDDVDGRCDFEFSGESDGDYVLPGGVTPGATPGV